MVRYWFKSNVLIVFVDSLKLVRITLPLTERVQTQSSVREQTRKMVRVVGWKLSYSVDLRDVFNCEESSQTNPLRVCGLIGKT